MNGLRRYDRLIALEKAIARLWSAKRPVQQRWTMLLKAHQRILRTAIVVCHYPGANASVRL